MKTGAGFSSARDRDGGAFCSAHVTRRRPAGADSFFTSLRRTPHPPDQVTVLHRRCRKANAYPATDGGSPPPSMSSGPKKRRPAHGLPCMASRLRQRGAVLRETLPTPFFTSLRRTPHPPDPVTVSGFCGCKAQTYPAKDGRYPDPVSKGGEPGEAWLGGHGRSRIPAVLGAPRGN